MRALRPIGETRRFLSGSTLLLGLLAGLATCLPIAHAQDLSAREQPYDIPAQGLAEALIAYSDQSGVQVVTSGYDLVDRSTAGIRGNYAAATALDALLAGSGMEYRIVGESTVALTDPNAPPITLAPAGGASGEGSGGFGDGSASNVAEARRAGVEEIIVTGQKKEERLQDVPIAISAFTMEDLDAQKLEGGFDLLKAIPNVTFSKSNFAGYNFSIRGVGTKAISATTDPGVAVSLNSAGLIQNRLFEQEYLDVERVEVLRGPQGTLYGRNATGGVINVVTAKPVFNVFEGSIKGEVGNYGARRGTAMMNIPLVDNLLALRAAGSFTVRDGYGFNTANGNDVDGRDLWSSRLTIGFQPDDRIRADLIWEHFSEDDNRARTSKQLCHKDPGPAFIGGQPTVNVQQRALFSAGCKPGSLYSDGAFDTPNGLALPAVFAVSALRDIGYAPGRDAPWFPDGDPGANPNPDSNEVSVINWVDPYGGIRQSRDLREISSLIDPQYRAEADILQLNLEIDVSDGLQLVSQTVYNEDSVYSTQDYNRFNTFPVFEDSSIWYSGHAPDYGTDPQAPSPYRGLTPGGIFCDPQLGCSSSIVGQDISSADGQQFTQELRLQSDFAGDLNFSLGASYTTFDAEADYYVLYNLFSILAQTAPLGTQADYTLCSRDAVFTGEVEPLVPVDDPAIPAVGRCVYVDPNPLDRINGEGHNYFRSRNPYELTSQAVFGELYWQIRPTLKLTLGLRYSDDKKVFTPVPSQLLLSSNLLAGGTTYRGYPESPDIVQRWREPTGRLVLDWQPTLSWTDETLVYGSYARGYKGGGANPPSIGFLSTEEEWLAIAEPGMEGLFGPVLPLLELTAVNYPETFEPEYVNAFELGTKNTMFDGALMLNASAFLYDYKGYQVSKIVDRTAVNENFDAKVMGFELETLFAPTPNWVINANVGLLRTDIGAGAESIDIMDRTAGNSDYVVVKPWFQLPSNCVVPRDVAEHFLAGANAASPGEPPAGRIFPYFAMCGGYSLLDGSWALPDGYDPANNPNGGAGIAKNLKGNELPNSPHWTANIGAQYTWHLRHGWDLTMRGDYYRQGSSWARVYNAVNDRLQGWGNANARLTVTRPSDAFQVELYVKNLLDDDPITDAFINSDDSGLTTNVFVLDPRLVGLSIRKAF